MLKQILIAIDQLLNTFIWFRSDGIGYADETLSARAWRIRDKSSLWKWIDRLFFWQKEHCHKAFMAEIKRRQLPRDYKDIIGA